MILSERENSKNHNNSTENSVRSSVKDNNSKSHKCECEKYHKWKLI